ncbi:hypothetical protein KIPB_008815 [Kipferlia bialata]|uniref:Uncharacterized protein n=1 Tax=Kipferlia bialata TaxID=797122 RepID=A0A9K3D3Y7_9EUKA|nr:hypothetical protein KIPB_008815 [Kipferlia bialata]|eukprot:g8815.t1
MVGTDALVFKRLQIVQGSSPFARERERAEEREVEAQERERGRERRREAISEWTTGANAPLRLAFNDICQVVRDVRPGTRGIKVNLNDGTTHVFRGFVYPEDTLRVLQVAWESGPLQPVSPLRSTLPEVSFVDASSSGPSPEPTTEPEFPPPQHQPILADRGDLLSHTERRGRGRVYSPKLEGVPCELERETETEVAAGKEREGGEGVDSGMYFSGTQSERERERERESPWADLHIDTDTDVGGREGERDGDGSEGAQVSESVSIPGIDVKGGMDEGEESNHRPMARGQVSEGEETVTGDLGDILETGTGSRLGVLPTPPRVSIGGIGGALPRPFPDVMHRTPPASVPMGVWERGAGRLQSPTSTEVFKVLVDGGPRAVFEQICGTPDHPLFSGVASQLGAEGLRVYGLDDQQGMTVQEGTDMLGSHALVVGDILYTMKYHLPDTYSFTNTVSPKGEGVPPQETQEGEGAGGGDVGRSDTESMAGWDRVVQKVRIIARPRRIPHPLYCILSQVTRSDHALVKQHTVNYRLSLTPGQGSGSTAVSLSYTVDTAGMSAPIAREVSRRTVTQAAALGSALRRTMCESVECSIWPATTSPATPEEEYEEGGLEDEEVLRERERQTSAAVLSGERETGGEYADTDMSASLIPPKDKGLDRKLDSIATYQSGSGLGPLSMVQPSPSVSPVTSTTYATAPGDSALEYLTAASSDTSVRESEAPMEVSNLESDWVTSTAPVTPSVEGVERRRSRARRPLPSRLSISQIPGREVRDLGMQRVYMSEDSTTSEATETSSSGRSRRRRHGEKGPGVRETLAGGRQVHITVNCPACGAYVVAGVGCALAAVVALRQLVISYE